MLDNNCTKKDDYFTPLTVKDVENYLSLKECQTFDNYVTQLGNRELLDFGAVYQFVKEHTEKFVLHFFINNDSMDITLQNEINYYIGQYSRTDSSRIYTNGDSLVTYYNSNGHLIEYEHDYMDYDGIEKDNFYKK